ncbi:MAG: HxsD-like protein [Lachnospiraceae bacterium]|nr:HxsD-like protein [Lachnospiraceae bacterium]
MNDSLWLNKELYRKSTIQQALKDYSGICEVQLLEEQNYYVCRFLRTVPERGLTMKEFEDYLISLTRKYEY